MPTVTVYGESYIEKHASATLDYQFDWTDWLANDTIKAYTVTVSSGLTKVSDTEVSGVITVLLSGGTAKQHYAVVCAIETNAGRIENKTVVIRVV
jgi:hypothetical protein